MSVKISVYTDGACKGNPGPGGWGWVEYPGGIASGIKFTGYGGEISTTNNRMELSAVIDYLNHSPRGRYYIIHSDSLQYVVKGFVSGDCDILKTPGVYSGWIKNWIKQDLTKRKNGDLWVKAESLIRDHLHHGSIIEIRYIKAHNGDVGNEFADKLANLGIPK